jgi:lipopolysaccharide/colanic/teichoic acid biosynthesis glycosyltransferase
VAHGGQELVLHAFDLAPLGQIFSQIRHIRPPKPNSNPTHVISRPGVIVIQHPQPDPVLPAPRLNRLRATWLRWRWQLHTRSLALLKRSLDLSLVLPALLLLAPLLALIALAVKLQDNGPILFRQKRVGLHGREFDFPKFRSMCVDAEARRSEIEALNQHGADGVTFKLQRDPRITPVGRWLRRFSLDELPQLWCVLRGDMTLVGPRPPLPSEVARYGVHDRHRLLVKPGLTCIWQVNGRSEIPFEQQVEMDIAYIRERSLGTDLKLLAKTVPAVVKGRGAY